MAENPSTSSVPLVIVCLVILALLVALVIALCLMCRQQTIVKESTIRYSSKKLEKVRKLYSALPSQHTSLERTPSNASNASSNIDKRYVIEKTELLEKLEHSLGEGVTMLKKKKLPGHYGVVYRSKYFDISKGQVVDVACKVLKHQKSEKDIEEFLEEAKTMMALRFVLGKAVAEH